ncbi:hypothetical protein HN011_011142 [Eciton burchellii]|nr:hypothetical protein HN011_011142 [Eciton burchellii]
MQTRGRKRQINSDLKYESLLTSFRERKGRLTRSTLRRLNKQNTHISSINSSSPNNIIVISSDNETNDDDEENISHSIIERKRSGSKRPSVILLDDDLPFVQSPNANKSFNGENIAPSCQEDDVVELWAHVVKDGINKKERSNEYNRNTVNKRLKFTIDTKPDMKNLEYLKINTTPVPKKQKISDSSHISISPLSEAITRMRLKYSKKSQRKKRNERQYNNNAYSNFTCLDAQCSAKKKKSKNIRLTEVDKKFENTSNSKHKLREIIVDGCNVAKMYTHDQKFSEKGIELVVNYFKSRGHVVKVFLPNHVRKKKYLFLEKLHKDGIIIFTPSRCINGKKITPYDDRYILEYATICKGIVISSDQYRDLYEEKPEWRDTILNRLLMPTFVGDYIMFPEDPLGKFGPNLDTFLQHQ